MTAERLSESPPRLPLGNREIAERFDEIAELLEAQSANPFRVRAYRTAADMLRALERPAFEILRAEGPAGLMQYPGIGQSLARAIEQLALTGRLGLLERLQCAGSPESLFASVPGIGKEMAARIHELLDIETLAELEAAAYDGRLRRVPGIGRKRIQAVRESLAGRFRRRFVPAPASGVEHSEQPPIEELLDVDRQYRQLAASGKLPRIAPRWFNPTCDAWLPILHTERGNRHYTALFSNTARAHELGAVRDWVVIYRDDQNGDGQWTAITAQRGELHGRRLIRGRDAECGRYYASQGRSDESMAGDTK